MCKVKGQSTGWVNEIGIKGKRWYTTGPYLGRSMVKLLARECGDHFLPEDLYNEQTFDERVLDREKEVSMARNLRDNMVLCSSTITK